jgi:hypothetical protein
VNEQDRNRTRSSRRRYLAFREDYAHRRLDDSIDNKEQPKPAAQESGEAVDSTEGAPKPKKLLPPKRKQYLREYLRWLWPHRFGIGLVFVLAILRAGMEMIEPLFMRFIVDKVLLNETFDRAARLEYLNLAGATFLTLIVISLPKLMATAWDSAVKLIGTWGDASQLERVVVVVQLMTLAIPILGITIALFGAARRALTALRTWSDGSGWRRGLVVSGLAAVVLLLALVWWPDGAWRPYDKDDKGTIQETAYQVLPVGKGTPLFRNLFAGDSARATVVLDSLIRSPSASGRARGTAVRAAMLAGRSPATARALLDSLVAGGYTDHHVEYTVGAAYAQLGDAALAVRWLERAAREGFACYPWIERDPLLAPIRADPVYQRWLGDLRSRWQTLDARYPVAG